MFLKEMKEITNETTYNRTVDMFYTHKKSNYLHKNIFFLQKKKKKKLQESTPHIKRIQLKNRK